MAIEKVSATHIRHESHSFTTMYNKVIQSIDDAFALGVYCYLSSLPHDWIVNRNQLMDHFNIGRDKLQKAMSWLKRNQLLVYSQERNADSTFGKSLIIIKDGTDFIHNIILNKQQVNAARPKVRSTEKSFNGRTTPTKEIVNTNKIKKIQKKYPLAPLDRDLEKQILPDWLPEELWQDFLKHRKSVKSPMTELAQKKAISALDKMRRDGQDIVEVINASIVNGWKGLFPIKPTQGITHGKSNGVLTEAPNRSWASQQWDVLERMGAFSGMQSPRQDQGAISDQTGSQLPDGQRIRRSILDLD